MDSPWIIAARLLEISLALIALSCSAYVYTQNEWWGYLTRIYSFAVLFLTGSTALFGSFSLSATRQSSNGIKFITLWIDLWAVAYFIASGILLHMCWSINRNQNIPLGGAMISFIGAALVIMLMLRSLALASRTSTKNASIPAPKYVDDEEWENPPATNEKACLATTKEIREL